MSIASGFTYGKLNVLRVPSRLLTVGFQRANRAQYAEVSLQSFNEEELLGASVSLPSVEGDAEDQGMTAYHPFLVYPLSQCAHAVLSTSPRQLDGAEPRRATS